MFFNTPTTIEVAGLLLTGKAYPTKADVESAMYKVRTCSQMSKYQKGAAFRALRAIGAPLGAQYEFTNKPVREPVPAHLKGVLKALVIEY